jgi:hypothetical protein
MPTEALAADPLADIPQTDIDRMGEVLARLLFGVSQRMAAQEQDNNQPIPLPTRAAVPLAA